MPSISLSPSFTRRRLHGAALAAAMALALPAAGWAQGNYPNKPITFIVPAAAGGTTDLSGRMVAQALAPVIGQSVIVENKGGGNGNLAAAQVKRAPADGYTLLMQYSGYHVISPHLSKSQTWQQNDFVPVANLVSAPQIIVVRGDLPVKDMKELVAYAKAHAGKLNYASSGNGSIQHIGGVLFARAIGAEMVHVPYRGAAPALQDVAGGRVEMFITTPSSAIALIEGGRVKALAMASARRAAGLPEVPTTAEAGLPGFTLDAWFAFAAPAATPRPIQERLNAALRGVAELPAVRQRAEQGGAVTAAMTLDQLDVLARKEVTELGAVIRSAGITIE